MKIELVAISELDGSAFCRVEKQIYSLEPPYNSQNRVKVDENGLGKAILHYGFSSTHKEFSDWESLIDYLNSAVKETRKAKSLHISNIDLNKDIIDLAPVEILERYLTRIEQKLIPNRQFDHAENILLTMINSGNVRKHNDILKKAVALLGKVIEKRKPMKIEEDMTLAICICKKKGSITPLFLSTSGQFLYLKDVAEEITETGKVCVFDINEAQRFKKWAEFESQDKVKKEEMYIAPLQTCRL